MVAGPVGALLVGALALAACGGASEQEQLVDTLQEDFGLSTSQADCVADQLYERFSDEQIDVLREADGRDDLPDDLLTDLRAALTPCAGS